MTEEPTQILEPSAPRRTRRLAIVGAVVALVVVAGGAGSYAVYNKLSGGGAQPHDVIPASVDAYARLDLDPSASQKIELFKFIRKFPDAAKELGITSADQDVRKLVFDELVSDACPDVDYEDDVEPWLGERIGMGGWFEEEKFVVAVQVTDESKARDGIKKLFACDDEDYGITFLDGYAVLSEDQKTVDDAVKEALKTPLGEDKAFLADFDELGDQGVASAWIDVKAMSDIPELKESAGEQAKILEQIDSVATTLRVDGSTIELAAVSGIPDAYEDKSAPLSKLPADTVVGLSYAGIGEQVREQYDTLLKEFNGESGGEFSESGRIPSAEDMIEYFEESTGLKLPEDLETFFGDSITLAIGPKNLEKVASFSDPSDIASLDVALRMVSDPDKALDLAKRIADLAREGGVELSTTATDDGAIIASNPDAADALVHTVGRLGDEKTFASVMPYGEDAVNGLYVNVGAILDKILEADPPDDVAEDIEEAKAIEAFGMSTALRNDRAVYSIRLLLAE